MQIDARALNAALSIAAQIVVRDGETYIPVFLRLEAEVERQTGNNKALQRAMELSLQE